MSAKIDGDFVVFLIGMKINKPWKVHQWFPLFSAMPKMIKELKAKPELGLLGSMSSGKFMVQYWRSFEHLDAYAKSKDSVHLPVWKAFNQSVANSRGDIGIWHETYLVKAGEYETIYSGMPPIGLGAAGTLSPITGSKMESARNRINT